MAKGIPDHILAQLEEIYIQNVISLDELAKRSMELVGFTISCESIRHYATQFRWGTKRRRHTFGKDGLPKDDEDMVDDLARIVYDTILDPENTTNPRELSSLVSAFMDIRKAGIRGSGPKTPVDTILDELRKGKII